ncbi:titin isoform X2 [Myripristis murdjan]|uniref:titin isoform X2 n=1 Tax=Myripristis murdjan TaxID=586833 RepID=UPI001175E108|nr:titin-like isoform X2 [Myripristis murdjan]
MASLCKRQQCTIERRGFRQELDSWRHKLIHCVGFESILEGLFGPQLIEDLKLFKGCEPEAVSDWSFDENCLFCCLRRDKVKEHLVGLSNQGLDNTPKPLLVKDQTKINRLEKQAEEFLNAVLCRKDVPSFSDPHIPVVAREIMQRMIRQFAVEYTSKTSSSQDSHSDRQPCSDQSLPRPPSFSGASPSTSPAATLAPSAHNQNPVLSKLLMADQEAPLDLTIKKPLAEPSEQEGVLDLSLKKNRYSSSLPVHSPYLSPTTPTFKGESTDLMHVAKSKDLQSTSTLEQFMAKLCPHHQRQIVDALGFLQTEVKALASSSTSQASNSTSGIQGTTSLTATSSLDTPEKSCPELRLPIASTPKGLLEIQDVAHVIPSNFAIAKQVPETAISLKTSIIAGSPLDLRRPGSVSISTPNTVDNENNRHSDHAPLKMKIMKTSNLSDGKKLSCVLTTSLSNNSGVLEERQGNSDSPNRTDAHSARLSSSLRHNQSSQSNQARQRDSFGHTKDTPAKQYSVHKSISTIPSDTPRTARKTIRGSSDHRNRDSNCRVIVDPDLGHCDIVYIDKPITECLREQQRHMLPRRNARKSTRGHMYIEEMWELKTVRTLAGRNERGNCPNPMPELITLVTPKQMLAKPDGVPPVDMPFAGGCGETISQQMPTEESDEREIPGTGDMVETSASEQDLIVETSQTDQCQSKEQSAPPSPLSPPTEKRETDMNVNVVQEATADSGQTTESGDCFAQASFDTEKDDHEPEEASNQRTEQVLVETVVESSETDNIEKADPQPVSAEAISTESEQQQETDSLATSVVEEREEEKGESIEDEQSQELQLETQEQSYNSGIEEMSSITDPAEDIVKKQEITTVEPVNHVMPVETEEEDDDGDDYDVSSRTMEALLKELPPWRRKRGTVISLPKRLRETKKVIVGYVNGRPISASDRSLRRRSNNSTPVSNKTPVKASPNVPQNISVPSVQNKPDLLETISPLKSTENTPAIPEVTEMLLETPSSPVPKCPSRSPVKSSKNKSEPKPKQIQEQKRVVQSVQDTQSTESKRPLRSARQKPAGDAVSPLPVNTVVSPASPGPTASHALPSAEHLPSVVSSSSLPVSSPLMSTSSPLDAEQSQLCTVPKTTVELNTVKAQPVDTNSSEMQTTEVENRLQTKQKLRSAKLAVDVSKNEKKQDSCEVLSTLENQSLVRNEMQKPVRSKRVHQKAEEASDFALQKSDASSLDDKPASGDDSSSSFSDKPVRMPLRSETSKAEMSNQSATQPSVDNKKLALRSQRLATASTSTPNIAGKQRDVASPIRMKQERVTKASVRSSSLSVSSVLPSSSVMPLISPRHEPLKQTGHKFFEALNGEENQHLITNLNIKYDKMQKGWVQMDKEGQPATKYKNKADRQAAIWKSKRRTRKPKCLEHQRYSPVQMLFMKNFDLTSICRWFLESTETKSLVIVKKVNTRLPSETQLCFHSSSGVSGTSQGLFPSLQAERLKKHLKKFAIASPVKSNPKSQKLIAKALEQEANTVKGKEKREVSSTTQNMTKPYCSSVETQLHIGEAQKASGKSKNPASARILRKYSNIRGKMQVQQSNVRLKKTPAKRLKATSMKRLTTSKSASKVNLKSAVKGQKSQPAKRMKESDAKTGKGKLTASKKSVTKPVQERTVKAQSSRALRDLAKKDADSPQRFSQRLGSSKILKHSPVHPSTCKVDSNKKQLEAEKTEAEKSTLTKVNASKIQTKELSQSKVTESKDAENAVEAPQHSMDVKGPISPDQVLTRSQRKMEAAVPLSGSPSYTSKKASKSMIIQSRYPKSAKNAQEPTLTRRGTQKSIAKRGQALSLSRSATTKLAAKRAQELLETPAKRTRTSHLK